MNDEIKEILDDLKNTGYEKLAKNIIDYITNLQQENERLKIDNKILKQNNINEVLRNDFDMCVKDLKKANKKIEKLENYKSRIDKTIEFINEYCKYNKITVNGNKYYDEYILNNVIDILRGEDNE